MGRGGSSDDEEGESGRKNLKRMLKVLKFFVGLMVVAITLDHVLFGGGEQTAAAQKQRDADRAEEVAAGRLGGVYQAEHAVEHAVEHTMHDFGAALSGLEQAIGLNTHIFHDDDERHAADADHSAERAAAIRDEEHGDSHHVDGEAVEPTFRKVTLKVPEPTKTTEKARKDDEADKDDEAYDAEPLGDHGDASDAVEKPAPPAQSSAPKWPVQLGAMLRKPAQQLILKTLNGKTRMLPDKTDMMSFQWDQPTPPPKPAKCVEGQKEVGLPQSTKVKADCRLSAWGFAPKLSVINQPRTWRYGHLTILFFSWRGPRRRAPCFTWETSSRTTSKITSGIPTWR